jgi:hypothetical protein
MLISAVTREGVEETLRFADERRLDKAKSAAQSAPWAAGDEALPLTSVQASQ